MLQLDQKQKQKAARLKRLRVTVVTRQKTIAARRRFIDAVAAVQPSQESEQRARLLVRSTRAAKEAAFLDQYKISA